MGILISATKSWHVVSPVLLSHEGYWWRFGLELFYRLDLSVTFYCHNNYSCLIVMTSAGIKTALVFW